MSTASGNVVVSTSNRYSDNMRSVRMLLVGLLPLASAVCRAGAASYNFVRSIDMSRPETD